MASCAITPLIFYTGAMPMMMLETEALSLAPSLTPALTLQIAVGHTMVLDAALLQRSSCLNVAQGLLRVAISGLELEPLDAPAITLGFLQAGDQLNLDLLRRSRLHLEAIFPVELKDDEERLPSEGSNNLNDWTVALLMIRHLGEAEQRIAALMQLLVERLGRRCGEWYELPMLLTHAQLAELSGHTRVTVTRQLSKWRKAGLISPQTCPGGGLRLAPQLMQA
jgi:hypothetical protein